MDTVRKILDGDVRAASKLMRDIDDQIPGVSEMLRCIYPHTGKAYVIGITGPPGSGKSTLVDKMIDVFRQRGKTVGVLAIDPTSPFSGGAILGDRIRMQRHATDESVFIRSLGTRGSLGGLSRSTQDTIHVMDAMGKDIILVETVGVGQDEVKIVEAAHTSIVLLIPGMGDDIQALKAGILEIADVLVINKADFDGAGRLEEYLRNSLAQCRRREECWEPPVVKTIAVSNAGVPELIEALDRHRRSLEANPSHENRLRAKAGTALLEVLQTEVTAFLRLKMEETGIWENELDNLVSRQTDPYSIAERLMARWLKDREGDGGF
jgi:LAO/AO transport system kinase